MENILEHKIIIYNDERIWVCCNHFCDKDGTLVNED